MIEREEEGLLDEFTYTGKPGDIASDAVRFLSGDTSRDPKGSLGDGEITYLLSLEGIDNPDSAPVPHVAVLRASIRAAEALAAKHAKEAAYGIQGVSESANQKAAEYRRTARSLRARLALGARPVIGGQSKALKHAAQQDPDRPQHAFRRDMFDGGGGTRR